MTNLSLRSGARSCAVAACLFAGAAFAQGSGTGGMALDGRPHPGSPFTGWTGNISPTDPYSAGPNMGAWITKAG